MAGPEPVYHVVDMTVSYRSLDEVRRRAPDTLAEHVRRSERLHADGDVLLAGAFLEPDPGSGYLRTMAVCRTREAAERFVAGDPFVLAGAVPEHRIRAWANMFAR